MNDILTEYALAIGMFPTQVLSNVDNIMRTIERLFPFCTVEVCFGEGEYYAKLLHRDGYVESDEKTLSDALMRVVVKGYQRWAISVSV